MQRPSVAREMAEARVQALVGEARRDGRSRRGPARWTERAPARVRAAVGSALVRAGARLLGEVRVP